MKKKVRESKNCGNNSAYLFAIVGGCLLLLLFLLWVGVIIIDDYLSTNPNNRKVKITNIYAGDFQNTNSLNSISATLKLGLWSNRVRLENSKLTFEADNIKLNLKYAGMGNCSPERMRGQLPNIFKAEFLKRGPVALDGYVSKGDIVRVCFNSVQQIDPGTRVSLDFIPEVGKESSKAKTVPGKVPKSIFRFSS